MKKRLLAMILVLTFLLTTMLGFNTLATFGVPQTSVHVHIQSGNSTIAGVAIKMNGNIIVLTKKNDVLYDGPDGGNYVFDKITHIIVTKTNGNVVTYSPASTFGGQEGGGSINYKIYATSEYKRTIPDFDLTKSVNPATSFEGDTVTYRFKIINNQNRDLHDVKVNDPRLGGDIKTIDEIDDNKSFEFTKIYTTTLSDFQNGIVENTATASVTVKIKGEKNDGWVTVTDSASASYNVSGYTLTTSFTGQGTVTVLPAPQAAGPNAGKYSKGTVVTISAVPTAGWQFDGWDSGTGFTVPDSNSKVLMDQNKAVKAIFTEIPKANYKLTVSKSGNGSVSPDVGEHSYLEGTAVTMSAIAASGWQFDGWDNGEGYTVPDSNNMVLMNSNKAVKAIFTEIPKVNYTLTVSKLGNGSVSPDVGEHSYLEGTAVTMSAIAASGWQFDRWDNGEIYTVPGPDNTVLMNRDRAVKAIFTEIPKANYTLTVSQEGDGTVTPSSGIYLEGTVVTLSAVPAAGWQFDGWADGEAYTIPDSNNTVLMDRDRAVKAIFTEITEPTQYTLTVNVVGDGTVTRTTDEYYFAPMSTEYDYYWPETRVNLAASPAQGWKFDGWSGDVTGSSSSASVVMTSNKSVTATFSLQDGPTPTPPPPSPTPPPSSPPERPSEQVTLNVNVTGQGTILPEPGDHDYNKGTTVQLSPKAAEGWKFAGWQGDQVNRYDQIYMNGNKKVTAVFEEINKPIETPTATPTPTPTPTPIPTPTPTPISTSTPAPDPVILPEEQVPTGHVLPKTGGVPANIFLGLGGLITVLGVMIKKKSK